MKQWVKETGELLRCWIYFIVQPLRKPPEKLLKKLPHKAWFSNTATPCRNRISATWIPLLYDTADRTFCIRGCRKILSALWIPLQNALWFPERARLSAREKFSRTKCCKTQTMSDFLKINESGANENGFSALLWASTGSHLSGAGHFLKAVFRD